MKGFAGSWLITGLPGEAPLRDGAVVFDGTRVVSVGSRSTLQADEWVETTSILMPGLVNAHVHLELSKLRGETRSGGGFGPWVASMMSKRDQLQPEQDEESIDAGISELLRSGTVAIGEISNTLASVPLLASAPLIGRVFHEVFGLSRESAAHMHTLAQQTREKVREWPRNLSYTLAPHTVFTLHAELLRALSVGRTSLHLSEHAAERAFLHDGTGPFADFLASRGVPRAGFAPPGMSAIDYALQLGLLHPELIAIHLCNTTRDELARFAATGAQAVLCPRSNLFIELKLPPLFDILDVGLKPGLGTDSLASNTTLDVLAEACALSDRFAQVDKGLLLSMATWYGAVALGLSHQVGALKPGLTPGLLAFELERPVDDPLRYLLRAPPPARRVLVRPTQILENAV